MARKFDLFLTHHALIYQSTRKMNKEHTSQFINHTLFNTKSNFNYATANVNFIHRRYTDVYNLVPSRNFSRRGGNKGTIFAHLKIAFPVNYPQ